MQVRKENMGKSLIVDEYKTKTDYPLKVVTRIKVQLRGYSDYKKRVFVQNETITCFNISLNSCKRTVKKNGQNIHLTNMEFKILELLMKNSGHVYTKEQIYKYAWNNEYILDDNTIMVHISNLRKKIEENPRKPQLLKTVRGYGYKMETEADI